MLLGCSDDRSGILKVYKVFLLHAEQTEADFLGLIFIGVGNNDETAHKFSFVCLELRRRGMSGK